MAVPYAPSVVSTGLASFPQIFYNRTAIENFRGNTPWSEIADFRPMPLHSGLTQQFFGNELLAAGTPVLAEGVPPNPLSLSQVLAQSTLSHYGDWIGISDIVTDYAISDGVRDSVRALAYRGALSSMAVFFAGVDSAAAADASSRIDLATGVFMTSALLKRAEYSLANANVPGRENGMYKTLMATVTAYDLFNDNTAGSLVDIMKRSPATGGELIKGMTPKNYNVVQWAGQIIVSSPNLPSTPNFAVNGKTGYSTYVVGKEAFIVSENPSMAAPRDDNYAPRVTSLTTPDLSNPLLQIASIVSTKWSFGMCARPNTNNESGFRRIRSESSIA